MRNLRSTEIMTYPRLQIGSAWMVLNVYERKTRHTQDQSLPLLLAKDDIQLEYEYFSHESSYDIVHE